MIVTIDGPAGAGKSTVAKLLADRLGFQFLDTGAMYRTVALAIRNAGIDPAASEGELAQLLASIDIQWLDQRIHLNGRDVSGEIRTSEITALSSIVAAIRRCDRPW